MSGTYRDLNVWQGAMRLTIGIYRAAEKFPVYELYGLSSQLRRAAVSVASNIAEGKGRSSDKELLQFLSCARGSLYEVETQLEIGKLLGYLQTTDARALLEQIESVRKMLCGMISTFRQATKTSASLPEACSLKPVAKTRSL
jgi:four helix bundle protein